MKEKLQPLSLYAESIISVKGIEQCIHVFNDTDNQTLRATGANTETERNLAMQAIARNNKRNIPIIWE